MILPNIRDWLDEWSRLWSVPQLPKKLQITPNPRLRNSLGRSHPATGRIHLHKQLADEPESLLREVVCHEAAHVAVHLLYGRRVRPHGPEWARLMRTAGYEPRVRMDTARLSPTFQAAVRPSTLYRHQCPLCGAARTARRPVRRWRCRGCHDAGYDGRLEITRHSAVEVDGPA